MKMAKKLLSVFLSLVLVFIPFGSVANSSDADRVYISISEEGRFLADPEGTLMAYREVRLNDLHQIDLACYGLEDYIYDSNGDGKQEVTALHLFIYVHEQILGLDFRDVDTSNGAPASMYFTAGLFGYEDENLRYDYNGAYPADENGWGFTADRIVLKPGDYLDVAHYSDWNFFNDSAYGFHYFADSEDGIVHEFYGNTGEEISVSLVLVSGGMGIPSTTAREGNYTVFYGQKMGKTVGSVQTDSRGIAKLVFPYEGTWHLWCNGGAGKDMCPGSIVSSPASAIVHITDLGDTEHPSEMEKGQDVSAVLNATMAQLAATVTEPNFGTNAGEWTVLSLARGGYYAKEHRYFADYYDRIVEKVNATASKVNLNGALHKNKSTDNSRLIVALSAIGRDAKAVGNWDLTAPYEDFNWIKKQGINGTIWALIALDSNRYATTDPTIRQQCLDYILHAELEEGGWSLSGTNLDVDISGMTLQALYPYRGQPEVSAAAERAFARLSRAQLSNGGFRYGTAETSESASQVIVACTTWGIDPDTDPRFVKEGNSVIDNLLSYYVEDEAMFAHQGTISNNMATDQACYALVAYDRLQKGKPSLYDFSDVNFGENYESDEMTATLGLPAEVNHGNAFHAVIGINHWDNDACYKLIDFVMHIPVGICVTDVKESTRLTGGSVRWNVEAETGKLRVVYFDANENKPLMVSGDSFPAELFTVAFKVDGALPGNQFNIGLSGMSVKLDSDSMDEASMIVVNTFGAKDMVTVVEGVSFSAVCLYQGDNIDLIPADKKAVAVAVTGIAEGSQLTFRNGHTEIAFRYSKEVTQKTGVATYIALVDAAIDMEEFVDSENYSIGSVSDDSIVFGDANGDGVINAQDALAAVDAWLRKGNDPTHDQILALNVNGDSRINTFDALGIVEVFVNGSEYGIVTKAATSTTAQE